MYAGVDAQLYEWNCSSLNVTNNRFTFPDLRYGDDENVANISPGLVLSSAIDVDIFPVPSTLNCSGTVSAIEFCYSINFLIDRLGKETRALTLMILEQNGLNFRITDLIDVRSNSTAQKCTNLMFRSYCCDTIILREERRFHLPVSNFAFGTIPERSSIFSAQSSHLRYRVESFPEFRVERYSLPRLDLGTPAMGDTFTLTDVDRRTDLALALLQFVMSK